MLVHHGVVDGVSIFQKNKYRKQHLKLWLENWAKLSKYNQMSHFIQTKKTIIRLNFAQKKLFPPEFGQLTFQKSRQQNGNFQKHSNKNMCNSNCIPDFWQCHDNIDSFYYNCNTNIAHFVFRRQCTLEKKPDALPLLCLYCISLGFVLPATFHSCMVQNEIVLQMTVESICALFFFLIFFCLNKSSISMDEMWKTSHACAFRGVFLFRFGLFCLFF